MTAPPPAIIPSKVEISVSCKNLIDKDILSKSDPIVVLFTEVRHESGKSWREYGRTEVIKDNLNPQFVTPFKIDYHFEQHQNLKFEVYDVDSSSSSLSQHDFLGSTTISLGSLMGENSGCVTKPLFLRDNTRLLSNITLMAEEMTDCKESVIIQFNAKKLDKKDFFGSSDPFLIIYRHAVEDNVYMPVHKTEVILNNLNPTWKAFEISLASLCNGDKLRPIKIECYDWNSDGSQDLIGICEVTMDDMLSRNNFPKDFINPKKQKKKKSYKNSGSLGLVNIELIRNFTFLDYVLGGVELCFHVAIDFTASNGVPSHPNSLHFIQPNMPNQYMQALLAVGRICEDYDSDKLMPAYGFGARIGGTVYHDFHLNQTQNPDCYGVMGIVEAYHRFLPTAELYGPTNFSPIINLVTNIARQNVLRKYHILLILTDGVITDMERTKMAIINASQFPISIIIVGVGNADFDSMDELDSDDGLLRHQGHVAKQDIVQFVPFNKFYRHYGTSEVLAEEVLREVPTQLVNYMKSHGIKPEPRTDFGPGNQVVPPSYQSTAPPNQDAPPPPHDYQGVATPYPNQGTAAPYSNQGTAASYPNQETAAPYSNQGTAAPYPNQGGSSPYSTHSNQGAARSYGY